MTGCKHNALRTIEYPLRKIIKCKGKQTLTFREGDNITLHCPYGCADVFVLITPHRKEINV